MIFKVSEGISRRCLVLLELLLPGAMHQVCFFVCGFVGGCESEERLQDLGRVLERCTRDGANFFSSHVVT